MLTTIPIQNSHRTGLTFGCFSDTSQRKQIRQMSVADLGGGGGGGGGGGVRTSPQFLKQIGHK